MDDPVLIGFRRKEEHVHGRKLPKVPKIKFVLDELINTERTYVHELNSIIEFYVKPFEDPQNASQLPPNLRGQSKLIFGNIQELYHLHAKCLLPEFEHASSLPEKICESITNRQKQILEHYQEYCHNRPTSEVLRRDNRADECRFFVYCQKRAGHPLPLSTYLLKPIQRITKYQLLLREILRFCEPNVEVCVQVRRAIDTMVELLVQINNSVTQLQIKGYNGDLRSLGELQIQVECEVGKAKSQRLEPNSLKKRHLFVFKEGVLICKKCESTSLEPSYNCKTKIPRDALGFAKCSTQDFFEVWEGNNKKCADAVYIQDADGRDQCIQLLSQMMVRNNEHSGGDKVKREYSLSVSDVSNTSVDSGCYMESVDATEMTTAFDEDRSPSTLRRSSTRETSNVAIITARFESMQAK